MKRTKKNLFCLLLIFTLLFTAGSVSFAADAGSAAGPNASPDGTIGPMTVIYSGVGLTRLSSTKAYIEVIAYSGLSLDKFTATITLQEKAFGSSTWKNSSADSIYVEEKNTSALNYTGQIGVTDTKNYRIKVVFKEYYGGVTLTTTEYSGGI